MMLRKNMDTLIFAIIASYKAHQQRQQAVAAPEEFQRFDLQALSNSVDTKASGSSSRRRYA
jgi:hypothetical protein